MDNNLPPTQSQVPTANTAVPQMPPVQNPVAPTPSMPIPPQEGSKKVGKLPLIIGIIVVLLILAGAGFWFMTRSQTSQPEPTSEVTQPAPDVAALNTLNEQLEADLNSIDVGNINQDLSEVDEDLKQL